MTLKIRFYVIGIFMPSPTDISEIQCLIGTPLTLIGRAAKNRISRENTVKMLFLTEKVFSLTLSIVDLKNLLSYSCLRYDFARHPGVNGLVVEQGRKTDITSTHL